MPARERARRELRELCRFENGSPFRPEDWADAGVPIIRIQNLNGSKEFNFFAGDIERHVLINDGDLLFSWSGNRGTSFGPFQWRGHVGVLNQHIFKLHVTQGVDGNWLFQALRHLTPKIEMDAHGASGLVHIKKSELEKYLLLTPPLPEQRRIAEILDTLDRTIESTQRIIDKLQATRQGLLHDLLTRGLDEHGQLRDPESNPEQFKETELGRLPRSWMVDYLNQDVYFQEGPGLREWQFRETGLPFLNIRCLEDGFIDKSKAHCISIEEANSSYSHFFLDAGDFVMSSSGTLGRISEVRQPDLPLMLNTSVIRFRPRKASLNSRFLWWVLQSTLFFEQITRESQGSAQANFGPSHLDKVRVALPDLPEQQRIAASLDSFTQTYKAEQNRLAKLQALKRGLMDDLLTGRVRVPVTAEEAVAPPAAPAPVAQQDAHSTIPFDRAPLAPVVNFRAAPGASSVAQADWVAQARTLAARQQPAPYSPEALDRAVAQLAALSVEPEGILQVPDMLRQAGVRFVLLQHPKGSKTSGAAFWLDDACRAEPVVALSMRYPLVDVFWFNLFHELGHIRHGHAAVLGEVLEPGSYRGDDAAESEANAYAREALIPDAVWQPYLESGNHSSRGLRAFARQVGRHHATVAGRLGHDLRDFPRFNSRELRPSVSTEVFERLVLRLGGSV